MVNVMRASFPVMALTQFFLAGPTLGAQGREVNAYASAVVSGTIAPVGRFKSGVGAVVALETMRCQLLSIHWGIAGSRLRVDSGSKTIDRLGIEPSWNLRLSAPPTWTLRPHLMGKGALLITSEPGTPMYIGAGAGIGLTHRRGAVLEFGHDAFVHHGRQFRFLNLRMGWSWRLGSEPRIWCYQA
jgi:hypothetical protein